MTKKRNAGHLILKQASDQMPEAKEDWPVLSFKWKHFDRVARGFRLLGMWFRNPGSDTFDPCLVFLRPSIPAARQIPCILRLSQAWVFGDPPVGDPEMAAAIAIDFARHLGLNEHDNKTIIRILLLIQDHIEDLIKIPPAPPMDRIVDGAARLITTDGKMIEAEVSHRA